MLKHDTTNSSPLPNSKKPFLHNFRISFSKKLLIIIGIFIVATGLFWVVIRSFGGLKSSKNIVFINEVIDGKIDLIIFAHMGIESEKLNILNINVSAQLLPKSQLIAEDKIEQQQLRSELSFLLGRVVDEVVIVENLVAAKSKTDLASLLGQSLTSSQKSLRDRVLATKLLLTLWQNFSPTQINSQTIPDLESWKKLPLDTTGILGSRECTVTVVNTTTQAGLGSDVSQLLEDSGLFVIRVTDTQTDLKESLVFHDGQVACLKILDHLQSVMPNLSTSEENKDRAHDYRANAVILVGEDIAEVAEWFSKPKDQEVSN